jgi:hypothetical protein
MVGNFRFKLIRRFKCVEFKMYYCHDEIKLIVYNHIFLSDPLIEYNVHFE